MALNLSDQKLCQLFALNDCVEWIGQNNYKWTCLQFSKDCLEYSSSICLFLKRQTQTQFYISYSTMCCVDYLSAQHLNESTVDSIIFFGTVCLTKSQFIDSLPVLYVFPKNYEKQSLDFIESSIIEIKSNNIIILYDTSNALMALELMSKFEENNQMIGSVWFAKLNVVSNKWSFTSNASKAVSTEDIPEDCPLVLGPFLLPNRIQSYDSVVYLGQCSSLEIILNCQQLLEIDVKNRTQRMIYANKELRKRVALIEKFKQNSCQSVGVVFTNPLPNVNQFFFESKKFGKRLKKRIYLISLLQTIDEYKLGNFPELNAFVVVNSCFCSSALNSINYCLPVLNWSEFEIASGLLKQYGGVQWNQNPDQQLSDSDESDVNDLCNQLIQTEVFDKSKWFGLEINAGDREAALIKTGQKGIASGYQNENIL